MTSTASLKTMVTLALNAMPKVPLTGTLALTLGAVSALPCGSGAPMLKSALLSSVSVAPPPARMAAVVLLVAPVGPVPS